MINDFYLKPNAIAEPLFNQWYAWSYLIPPATAARYVANSHLKIMESFVATPQVHADALKNPEMIGAPFINHSPSRVWEIEALLEKTRIKQKYLLDLDKAIASLDFLLKDIEMGASLEPLYNRVPEILKGYVELVYDRHNNAGIRFIEGLLYRSPLYDPSYQSVYLYLDNPDSRSFVLSTPRLPSQGSLQIDLPFCDRRWDSLFKMRSHPQDLRQIKQQLEINPADAEVFASFFTSQAPTKKEPYQGDDVRIRYFGHACVLIETKNTSILCDPLIAYPNPEGIPRYSYDDLPDSIDYALITHNHQDHVMFETLLQIRHKVKHLVIPKSNRGSLIDPSLKLILQQIGFTNVLELDELESISLSDGEIISIPVLGEHGDLNISTKNAYLIQLQGKSILCAADSNNIEPELYRHLHNCFGDLDIMFIGMECDGAPFTWAYGALLEGYIPRKIAATRRLDGSDSQKAIALVKQFNPQQVYVYAMGQEPWLTYITSIQYTPDSKPIVESDYLVEFCQQHNIVSERLYGRKEIFLTKAALKDIVPLWYTASHKGRGRKGDRVRLMQAEGFLKAEIVGANGCSPMQRENVDRKIEMEKFVKYLRGLDIKVSLDGSELAIDAPKGALNKDLIGELKKRKLDLIEFLR
ncbi:MAG: MBL fold metallo-hydrolase [Cyanobacteria bacterium P01_G01_bin.19]